MTCEVVQTRWGTSVMRDLQAGEVMHPGVGPKVEAEQLYVLQSNLVARLQAAYVKEVEQQKPLVLFDVGLGAGSNAAAAWSASQQITEQTAPLKIVSFERDLCALTLALAHGEAFGLVGQVALAAQALLKCGHHETLRISWQLRKGDLLDCLLHERTKADVIFWDPFSPKANPALWTVQAFSLLRAAANPTATLYTYSASTTVRIAMLLAGWSVGTGVSIGDKTATTAAAVRVHDLASPLGLSWLSRVARADVRLPADAGANAVARVQACAQFASQR